ncbi:flagellar biosynthetic protein FliR [Telmatobacter bradus]|uniref:flagellar biosynthetic protein FliR n=1 Tax=Telmatobacter bradus TaxID=474953 RepID=UPI003B434B2C
MTDWPSFLCAMTLALIRVSGIFVFAPPFNSNAIPMRTKAVLAGLIAWLISPLVATLPGAHVDLTLSAILGELAVGLVYGLCLAMLNEMLLFAGQVLGMQFSFSLVNLMDPTSNQQTSLLGDFFQLMGTLVIFTAGLDRILLASFIRSFHAVPLGGYALPPSTVLALVHAVSGVFLAAIELAAPVLSATMLVEVSISLLGKISPQLPVMNLSVPIKTLTGFGVLIGSLALWPHFIEGRFASLLDMAERLVAAPGHGG